jgi:hypothetical protein
MLYTLAIIFIIHYFADFILQTEHQAVTKSFNIYSLAAHCITYSLPFMAFGIEFGIVTGVLHFAIDFFH